MLLTLLKDQHGKHRPNSTRTPSYNLDEFSQDSRKMESTPLLGLWPSWSPALGRAPCRVDLIFVSFLLCPLIGDLPFPHCVVFGGRVKSTKNPPGLYYETPPSTNLNPPPRINYLPPPLEGYSQGGGGGGYKILALY